VSSVVALLTPVAARIHIGVLIVLRVMSGLGEGVMLPTVGAMIVQWSSPRHFSTIAGIVNIGGDVGLGMIFAGVLCDYGFAGGWPSVFYVYGMVGCVWFACWCLFAYNSPSSHPLISTAELEYWKRTTDSADLTTEQPPTPWRKIFTSAPVWALATAYFANNFFFFTLLVCVPLYLHDVLGVSIATNGVFSFVTFAGAIISTPITGAVVDWLRSSGRLTTTVVRKGSCVAGLLLVDCCLILLGFVGCNRALAVTNLFFMVFFDGIVFNCLVTNQMDLAPAHAGKIMGLVITVANLGSILGPIVVGAMTAHQSTHSTWQNVFFLMAVVNVFAAVVFLIFGSGNRQNWDD